MEAKIFPLLVWHFINVAHSLIEAVVNLWWWWPRCPFCPSVCLSVYLSVRPSTHRLLHNHSRNVEMSFCLHWVLAKDSQEDKHAPDSNTVKQDTMRNHET